MAYTVTKNKLSGSTNGKQIKITTKEDPGTLIHTCVSETTDYDEIWLYATNTNKSAIKITTHFNDDASNAYWLWYILPPQSGWICVCNGWSVHNGAILRMFANLINVVNVAGYVIQHRN